MLLLTTQVSEWRQSAVSDSLRPRELYEPTMLLCPWDFPGKSTGAGCHFLLQLVSFWINTKFKIMLITGNWKLTLSTWFGIKAIKFYVEFLKKCDFAVIPVIASTNLMKKDFHQCPSQWYYLRFYTFVSFKMHMNS